MIEPASEYAGSGKAVKAFWHAKRPHRLRADEVELRLKAAGVRPNNIEGYNQAEWILIDYVDFVVHIFSERARKFYDLERLWKSAKRLQPGDLKSAPPKRKTAHKPAPAKKKKKARA